MMKTCCKWISQTALTCAMLMALTTTRAYAGDVYVICNDAMSVGESDIVEIFTGEKQVAGSTKVTPFDNAAAQKDMLEKVLKLDQGKYNSIWAKKGFRAGLNPPAVKGSDAEVVAAVKANPGGVGYVTSKPDGVKVVKKY